ncbi:MAG: DUF1501 domain-containing protein [Planctomycetota bacterium]|nr:DUF1501 domain-containing protein [Planctomycetota bacterium]
MMSHITQSGFRLSRRQMIKRCGAGFGALGLTDLIHRNTKAATPSQSPIVNFPARAKRVIFLFMNGGPSHVDLFDEKPALAKYAGELPKEKTKRNNKAGYWPTPFRFKKHGQSGVEISELMPRLASCADDLTVIRSMYADEPNHEPGLLLMNSGNQQPIRPSLGSWASYGLGSENENLPAFVVLCPGRPVVGPQLWSNAFLPPQHQGMSLDTNEQDIGKLIANLNHPVASRREQREQLDLLRQLNQIHSLQRNRDMELEAHIKAFEMAFQMQKEASDVFDLNRESRKTRDAYGDTPFGRSCLMARRLAEADVRFTQVYYVTKSSKQPWDTHNDNAGGHIKLCRDADQATAALISDLKQRGMLDETLVIWGGEFGRTPFAQKGKNKSKPGRDHHSDAFSMVLAGGGTQGGLMYGKTDDFGMHALEKRVHVHDLHATILHLMGIDHEKLTYRYSGRDFRLTDVYGKVVRDLLA